MLKPFEGLTPGAYGMIMVDPPWRFKNWSEDGGEKSAAAQYRLMSFKDICALPVGTYAAEDCCLWLWATNPLLDKAFDVLAAWGFTFKTAGHWVKRSKRGSLALGTGYIFRGAGEPYLIGTRGTPNWGSKAIRSVIETGWWVEGPLRQHSEKPESAYIAAEALVSGARRADIFSRTVRHGWDSWGDEVGVLNRETLLPPPTRGVASIDR